MGHLGLRASASFAFLAALAMLVVVATAPSDFPTPTDAVWGHEIPQPQSGISLGLLTVAAVLCGAAGAFKASRRRSLIGVTTWLVSSVILLLLSVVIWRVHAPVSAGNRG